MNELAAVILTALIVNIIGATPPVQRALDRLFAAVKRAMFRGLM